MRVTKQLMNELYEEIGWEEYRRQRERWPGWGELGILLIKEEERVRFTIEAGEVERLRQQVKGVRSIGLEWGEWQFRVFSHKGKVFVMYQSRLICETPEQTPAF